MYTRFLTYCLVSLFIAVTGSSQSLQLSPYHTRQQDHISWQRLNLQMAATYLNIVKEGQADLDSCLEVASRSLGISRYAILAEGIDNPALMQQSQWLDNHHPATGSQLLATTKGIRHRQVSILLGAYYAFQKGLNNRDSATYYLNNAISNDPLGRIALCLLGKVYFQQNDPRGDSIVKLLLQQGDTIAIARIIAYRGIYLPPGRLTIQQKLDDLQLAVHLYMHLKDTTNAINVLTDLGYMQIVIQNLTAAEKNMQRALRLEEAIHYPYIHYSTQALTTVTTFQGKFGEPLKYVYQTIKVAENVRDSLAWSYFYTRLSLLLSAEGRDDESFAVAQKSVKRFVADRNTSVYGILNDAIGYMIQKGQSKEALHLTQDIAHKVGIPTTYGDLFFYHNVFSNCYLALDRLDEAELHIKQLDSIETKAEAIRGHARRSTVNMQFAALFLKRKQYQKARQYFEKDIDAPSFTDNNIVNNLYVYRQLIFIDSIMGDQAAGIRHYRKYSQLIDASFRAAKIRQAEELQVRYQIQEKNNQIVSLTQEAKLEKAHSEKAALIRNITIAGIIAIMIIVGLLYRQNKLIRKLLTEKEWLVKEIHHRVKNNLQVIMSLLDSQAQYLDDTKALNAVQDNLRRVHAMALIHQKLYLTDNVSAINMPEYISELLHYAQDSFEDDTHIQFEQQIAPLALDVSQAIPLGLIINESIVNAMKYAFPARQKGLIKVSLQREGEDIILQVSDNGTGLPAAFDLKAHKSLGLDLMQGLSNQLEGSFHIENNNGLHITIRFVMLTFSNSI